MKLQDWLTAGINIGLCIVAFAGVAFAAALIWRNYRLKAVIKQYRLQVMREAEKSRPDMQTEQAGESGMADALLPVELFQLLQIRTEEDLERNKLRRVMAANVSINNNGFSGFLHMMHAEAVFSFLNAFLERAVPVICEAGGIIEDFEKAGMAVLLVSQPERALPMAVSLCEQLNELAQQQEQYAGFSIGITYEHAVLGMAGTRRRMGLLMLSEDSSGLSSWLQEIAEKYYARILVTETYAALIEHFQRNYHVRLLGYIYVADTDSVKKIYDVFDGDEKEVRNRKRQTKMLFEKGVGLFAEQEYAQARQYFIEVLKTDRFDRAAKEYVFRCEMRDGQGDTEKKDLYLECYG